MNWDGIYKFQAWEFDSPDAPGSGEQMQRDFVLVLDAIRIRLGMPLIPTSGYRTPAHNDELGAKPNSAHLSGWAADLAIRSDLMRERVVELAIEAGIRRIGIAKTFVHLDLHPTLPSPRLWVY